MSVDTTATAGASVPVPPTGPIGSNFTSSNCGSLNGIATGPALEPGAGYLAINGSVNLSSCIVGANGANIETIQVALNTGDDLAVYKYVIEVYGQGPAGIGSGELDLVFTDQTGDAYRLSLFKSETAMHTVKYKSSHPGIVTVQWSPS